MVSHPPTEEHPIHRPPSHHQSFAPHYAPGLPPPLNAAPATTQTYSPHTHLEYHHHPPPPLHGYAPHAPIAKEEHPRPHRPYASSQDQYHSPHQGPHPPAQVSELDRARRSPPQYGRYGPPGPAYATTYSAASGSYPAPVNYSKPQDPPSPHTGRPPNSAGPEAPGRPPHVERENHHRRPSMDCNAGHYPPHPQQHTLAEHLEQQSASQHHIPPSQGPPAPPPPPHGEHHMHPGYPPHVSHFPPPPSHWDASQYAAYYDIANGQAGQQRRKAVRAAQACDNCRAKKAKCDENRPTCGNCETQQITCNYRTVPPPKLDRTYQNLSHAFDSAREESNQMIKEELQRQTETIIQTLERYGLKAPSDYDARVDHARRSVDYQSVTATPPSTVGPSLQGRQMSHDHASYMGPYRSTLPQNIQAASGGNGPLSMTDETLKPFGLNSHSNGEDKHAQLRRDASKDFQDGQLSIPAVHTTAAHEMRSWLGNDSFFQGVSPRYVMEGESKHHLIFSSYPRVPDSKNRRQISSPALGQSPADDASTSSSSSGTSPAAAFVIMNGVEGSRGSSPSPGGRNPNQSLSIDEATAHRLRKSFFHNVHILQPCMDKVEVTKMVNNFIDEYCSEPVVDVQLHAYAKVDSKKRRYNETLPNGPQGQKLPIQRSVENALVLLVFALGRVSEHKGRLPPPVGQETMESIKSPSTTSTPTTRQAFSIPFLDRKSPRIADDQYTQDCRNYQLNIDRLPGAAYYSHAVSILGENVGGNTLLHVQASLLAGLYLAQYAFVYDSWKWIHMACTAWLMLLKEKEDNVEALLLHENLTYWTCLILESDILAELHMVPSGVSTLEDTILPPPMVNSADEYLDGEDLEIREHFLAQIQVRKILNRAHTALYQSKANPERVKSQWARLNSDDLAWLLEGWRKGLPPRMRWSESDDPARSIMMARLRAKYYGARNIIFRPFLHRVITSKLPENMGPPEMDHNQRLENETKTFANALQCIEAVKKSTVAFDNVDGMPERLVVTNIFGTAHAQWGNCLVLGAACQSEKIDQNFTPKDFRPLLDRTIGFLSNLAHLSPTMGTNLQILQQVKRHFQQTQPSSAHSSFIAE